MLYPREVFEEVRLGNDIIDVIGGHTQLRPKGNSYFGLCPFHKENTPSFSVSAEKQLYHCFGCGESGNVYSFIMKMENMNFIEAVRHLAARINYVLPEKEMSPEAKALVKMKEEIYEINVQTAKFFYETLQGEEGEKANIYLDKRGLNPSLRRKFGLGLCPDRWDSLFRFLSEKGYDNSVIKVAGLIKENKNGGYYDIFKGRLMFPIFDSAGRVVGFGGRILGEGMPKYLNSPQTPVFDKSRNLYGINFARKSRASEFILVEGYMDALSLHQIGITNAVASLGTAFNKEHARTLKKYVKNAVLLFDSDGAGEAAAARTIPVLEEQGIKCRVLSLNGAKDPDEFINRFGSEEFISALNNAKSSTSFQISKMRKKHDLSNTQGKADFAKEVAAFLASIDNEIEKTAYIGEVSEISGISEQAISAEVAKLTKNVVTSGLVGRSNTIFAEKNKLSQKGAVEAKKVVIKIASASPEIAALLKGILDPIEMQDEVYSKLLEIIYESYAYNAYNASDASNASAEGDVLKPAELVSCFETYEEQSKASAVFTEEYHTDEKEKVLNQSVKKIKMEYIEHELRNINDVSEVSKFVEAKRKLNELNINLKDCEQYHIRREGLI